MIIADWAAPTHIKTLITTRLEGVSQAPFDSNNLGNHVGDNPNHVAHNRESLVKNIGHNIVWLNQTHSTEVLTLGQGITPTCVDADASFTNDLKTPCCVMTADCLPLLVTNNGGTKVAAIHGGWRGLANGIIENTLSKFQECPSKLMVWLGPAIGPRQFEVGQDVVDTFVGRDTNNESCFVPQGNKYLADIYQLARNILLSNGVTNISGGDFCTVEQETEFYSYRRDGQTGRMASLIWIENN